MCLKKCLHKLLKNIDKNTDWKVLPSVGFKIPPDFPSDLYNKVNSCLAKYNDKHSVEVRSFGLGWKGVVYRYRALSEYDDQFTASIIKYSNSPSFEERYIQGKALFGFFVNVVSIIECFFFSTYCIASILEPGVFSILEAEKLRLISPSYVHTKFQTCFPKDCISIMMGKCIKDPTYIKIGEVRDVLTHRGMPPRSFYRGGERNGMATMPDNIKDPVDQWQFDLPVDAETTASRRLWLSDTLKVLIAATDHFCSQRL